MRMSKLIREYITEEITKKYQPLIAAAEEERNLNPAKKVMLETAKELKTIATQMWRERLAPYYDPDDLEAMIVCTTLIGEPHKWGISSIQEEKYAEKLNKLRANRDKAIKDTLIAMELGGTKDDLDKLLAAINPEEV